MGWPVERVTAVLERAPATEYHGDGSIVGYGLTLRETAHALEIDGRRLDTWCALDTLIFPTVLGKAAHVFSQCAASEVPIVLTVTPDGVQKEPVQPAFRPYGVDLCPRAKVYPAA